ncbi:sugar phosphate isomerase/epimerase [uncultured Dysosmobacter sp.]|uniref:sugar phosphate isomerase/epimerase family protein n=1 Tax=uncultured Dysosmobacter sp. TaxID=2591384 RepID=UPI00260CD112|nr:TIM barrel protein [uncultured Dysosmobacter sp.]
MRIGCCIPISKYEQVVKDGYDYVEFPGYEVEALTEPELAVLTKKIKESGIGCDRLNAYSLGKPAIVGGSASPEETQKYAESLIKKASMLHVKSIGIGSPLARRLPQGFDRALADRQCEMFLHITGKIAAAYGINILLEAVQKEMCSYMNYTSEALSMVKKVSMDNVQLVVDLYHMETMHESWEDLKTYIPWVQHLHVSTVGEGICRGLYGTRDEAYCRRTFQAIAASGYDGSVSIEPDHAALTPEATKTALSLMRSACEYALHQKLD